MGQGLVHHRLNHHHHGVRCLGTWGTGSMAQQLTTEARRLIRAVRREFSCERMVAMYQRYLQKGVPFEIGRTRVVFVFDSYVVKLPYTYGGIGDNDWEGSLLGNIDPNGAQYARTRHVSIS